MKKEDFYFFWKNRSPFSQWYPSKFTVDGIEFNCCEQWMMYSKAMLFGDKATAQNILLTKDPKIQKDLGRKVKGFKDNIWTQNRERVVYEGNLAKFSQSDNLKKILLDTGMKILAEASPYDLIWGIGLEESDPRAIDMDNWEGLNLLGKALMKVRETLKN